jgi:hypothetical protein
MSSALEKATSSKPLEDDKNGRQTLTRKTRRLLLHK